MIFIKDFMHLFSIGEVNSNGKNLMSNTIAGG